MAKRNEGTTLTSDDTGSNASVSAAASKKKPAAAAPARTQGRSGGSVDAPGKKHRKAMPSDPDATIASSQAAKMRTAKTMVKTNRLRARG